MTHSRTQATNPPPVPFLGRATDGAIASAGAGRSVEGVAWDLDGLLPEPGEAGVRTLMARGDEIVAAVERVKGRLGEINSDEFVEVFTLLGELADVTGRLGSFGGLQFSVDTADPVIANLMQRIDEWSARSAARLVFVEVEWAALSDEAAETRLADSRLDFCRHHLRSARRYRDHILSESEERVLAETSTTGASAWSRLFDEQCAAIEVRLDDTDVALEVALSELQSPIRERRAEAAAAVTAALEHGLRTRAFIFNTLLADRWIDDRLRGYGSWVSARNLANEASDESVEALVDAVVARYDLPQRWYSLKAQMLGVERLADYDRMAPLGGDEDSVNWDEACELVRSAYHSLSPRIGAVVDRFLDEPWIDAPTRPAKRGGAFCAYTVPSHHPYLLLNWTDRRRDVLTLAHELGHGVHAYLAREQGVFHQSTPLTLAETASVFGEAVTFGRLLDGVTEPAQRLSLLSGRLEDQIATVFRQVAMNRFEHAVHLERRDSGELSVERFGDLWAESQTAMLGDAVEVTDGYRSWWSYIPHFVHTPGYVYAYAFGQLLALSVYARYEADGSAFVGDYETMLSAGGSRSPEDLCRLVGVDLADPGFWASGLGLVDSALADAEAAAAEVAGGRSG